VTGGLEVFADDQMPADEVEEHLAEIGVAVEGIWPRLIALYQGRAWLSLGLPSWQALCDERMKFRPSLAIEERREVVRELTGAGMSTRAIGAVLDIGNKTAQRDQQAVGVSSDTPLTGTDGTNYTRPPTPPEVIQAAEDFLQADGSIRAANLRHGFAKWAASIHRVHLFDPAEIAALGPDLGDRIGLSVEALDQWWAEYQTARRQGLRVIEGGNA